MREKIGGWIVAHHRGGAIKHPRVKIHKDAIMVLILNNIPLGVWQDVRICPARVRFSE
jgi:hypothetical protein